MILTDVIVVEPEKLGGDIVKETKKILKEKYLGKIIRGKGFCRKIKDFKVIEPKIGNGSGNLEIKVQFKCLLFNTFRGEQLEGTIT